MALGVEKMKPLTKLIEELGMTEDYKIKLNYMGC